MTPVKNVTVIKHPLVQHNLTRVRDERTEPQEFRRLLGEIASLMIYEATRSLKVKKFAVRTPLEKTVGSKLEREIVLIPILRAGLGMLNPGFSGNHSACWRELVSLALSARNRHCARIFITRACPRSWAAAR